VGIITTECNGYFIPVSNQIKIVTDTSFTFTATYPPKKLKWLLIHVTGSPKKLKWLHRYHYLSPQKIVMDPSFSLLTLLKNLNGYIVTITWLFARLLAFKNRTIKSQLWCLKFLCDSVSVAPSFWPKWYVL
jgi:hypothetical protein